MVQVMPILMVVLVTLLVLGAVILALALVLLTSLWKDKERHRLWLESQSLSEHLSTLPPSLSSEPTESLSLRSLPVPLEQWLRPQDQTPHQSPGLPQDKPNGPH